MDDATGGSAALTAEHEESKGPRDDFFCWKFRIWYPSEDCVYRHSNRTHPDCSGCFQGRMNQRHTLKGLRVPVVIGPGTRAGP